MRVTSSLWVSAHIRRCFSAGAFAVIERKGAEEAGAIYIRVDRPDGQSLLLSPAPQSFYDENRPMERKWHADFNGAFVERSVIEEKMGKEFRIDPDIWIVVIEDRDGRAFVPEDLLV